MKHGSIEPGPRKPQNLGLKHGIETGPQKQRTLRARTVRAQGVLHIGGPFWHPALGPISEAC